MFVVGIIYIYYTIKNKNLQGWTVALAIGEENIGFALKVIGIVKGSKKVNSKQIPAYYLYLNSVFIFSDVLIFMHHVMLPCSY